MSVHVSRVRLECGRLCLIVVVLRSPRHVFVERGPAHPVESTDGLREVEVEAKHDRSLAL
jgi:hypothetical protein